MLEEVYTPEEVGNKLKISPRSVKNLLRSGKLHGFKAGRKWRVRKSDLVRFMEPVDFAPLDLN